MMIQSLKSQARNSCEFCRQCPCVVDGIDGSATFEEADEMLNNMNTDSQYSALSLPERKSLRYLCYRRFHRVLYGIGKRGQRKELPLCVMNAIREKYPEEDNSNTTGFRHLTTGN